VQDRSLAQRLLQLGDLIDPSERAVKEFHLAVGVLEREIAAMPRRQSLTLLNVDAVRDVPSQGSK
jgi:hypothetical protein